MHCRASRFQAADFVSGRRFIIRHFARCYLAGAAGLLGCLPGRAAGFGAGPGPGRGLGWAVACPGASRPASGPGRLGTAGPGRRAGARRPASGAGHIYLPSRLRRLLAGRQAARLLPAACRLRCYYYYLFARLCRVIICVYFDFDLLLPFGIIIYLLFILLFRLFFNVFARLQFCFHFVFRVSAVFIRLPGNLHSGVCFRAFALIFIFVLFYLILFDQAGTYLLWRD